MRGRRSRRKRVSGKYCAESAAAFSVCLPSYHGGLARVFGGCFEAQGGSNGVSRSWITAPSLNEIPGGAPLIYDGKYVYNYVMGC